MPPLHFEQPPHAVNEPHFCAHPFVFVSHQFLHTAGGGEGEADGGGDGEAWATCPFRRSTMAISMYREQCTTRLLRPLTAPYIVLDCGLRALS